MNNNYEKTGKQSEIGDNQTPKKSNIKSSDLSREIIKTLETIEDDYGQFKNTIKSLKGNLQDFMESTSSELSEVKRKAEEKAEKEIVEKKVDEVEEDIDHVDERLTDVMEEIGFGKTINVAKIPPILLEDIYQMTLDDIVNSMRNNIGDHDTNIIINEELEKMRTRTSGSELFQYDGRNINIRNLVPSIKNNLISAKQIHSTYTELIEKLSEKIPGYEPRNFRAMVNSKGLEFAIEKSTELLDRTSNVEEKIKDTQRTIDSLEDEMKHNYSEINEKLTEIETKLEDEVENKFNHFDYRIAELEENIEGLDMENISNNLESLVEGREELKERLNEISSDHEMQLSILEQDLNKMKEKFEELEESKLTNEEKLVYYSIPEDGATSNRLEKEVGESVGDIEDVLNSLVEKNKVKTEQRGRWTVYVRIQVEESKIESEKEDLNIEEGIGETEIEKDEEGIIEDEENDVEFEGEEEEEESENEDVEEQIEDEKTEGIEFDESLKEQISEGMEEPEEDLDDYDYPDSEQRVLNEIPDDGCTIHHLNKQFEDLNKSDIEDILDKLINENKVSTTKRNRWTIYLKQKEVE